jgi:membrane-bound lytic murein transglycosylase D
MRKCVLIFCFVYANIANAGSLPEPTGLRSAVKFWEAVFHTYRPNHCIIHDRDHLESIFIVKIIPDNRWRRKKAIKTYKNEVKKSLVRLGKGVKARTSLEKRVVKGTPKYLRKPSYYRQAANRLRCQRGVDLRPSMKRSLKYIADFKSVFRKKKMPTDLAYLPHLESGFHKRARSRAGARGIWQFMPHTARALGLKVKRNVDHRTDPVKSTTAAAKHLAKLYKQTKSWPLAVTAYNYGPNGVRRAIKKYGRDYMKVRKYHKTRLFRFAAKNYYPSFLAVRNVASRLEKPAVSKTRLSDKSSSRGRVSF